jgi:hypothetical protein
MSAYGTGFGIFRGGGGSTAITGSGTPNYQARFITASTIGDGVIQDDGTTTGIGVAPVANQVLTIKGDDALANYSLVLTDSADVTQFGFKNNGALELTALGKLTYADGFGGDLISSTTTALRTWNFPDASGEILLSNLLGVANGIATLDSGGKVPNSQLPFNLMEFLGNWNATTNTPTLSNADVGAQGNTYKVSVAGTQDFGAGAISFDVGDWVVNNGTIWEKVDNTDAVTSVNGNVGVVTTPFADVLAQGTTTGANSISVTAGQKIIHNNGGFTSSIGTDALTVNRLINYPDASGTVALTTDVMGIYGGSGTTPSATAVTITDTLGFGTNLLRLDETNKRVGINTPNTSTSVGFRVLATNGFGTYIDGDSVSASEYALKIRNFDGVSTFTELSRFRNSGKVELALNGTETTMGDTASHWFSQLTTFAKQNTSLGTHTGFEAVNTTGVSGTTQIRIDAYKFDLGIIESNKALTLSAGWNGLVNSIGIPAITVNINGNVGIGKSTTSAERLIVRGFGNTSATTLVRFESLSATARFLQNDAGQIGTGAGVAASISTIFGQHHKTAGYTYGVGYYGNNHSVSAVGIFPQGSTKWGLYVTNQGTYTGVAVMVYGNAISAVTNTNIGTKGSARNGSSYAIGLDGTIVGGASVASSVYVAGVRGNNGSNVHVNGYGGHFLSQQAIGILYTKDIVGVYGKGSENAIANASTGKVIGGQFLTTTSGGGATLTAHMAINVPSTGNDGIVVIGADLASARASMVEVTGNIELIAIGNGFIVKSPDGTSWKFTPTNAGAWTSVSV